MCSSHTFVILHHLALPRWISLCLQKRFIGWIEFCFFFHFCKSFLTLLWDSQLFCVKFCFTNVPSRPATAVQPQQANWNLQQCVALGLQHVFWKNVVSLETLNMHASISQQEQLQNKPCPATHAPHKLQQVQLQPLSPQITTPRRAAF